MIGKNGLFNACARGDSHRVAELLKKGASVNKRNERYATPLIHTFCFTASPLGHPVEKLEVARLLLLAGADPNAQDNTRYTALLYTVLRDYPEGVELLLRYGADVSLLSTGGISAIWLARLGVMYGYVTNDQLRVLELLESSSTFPKLGGDHVPAHWPEGYKSDRKRG